MISWHFQEAKLFPNTYNYIFDVAGNNPQMS